MNLWNWPLKNITTVSHLRKIRNIIEFIHKNTTTSLTVILELLLTRGEKITVALFLGLTGVRKLKNKSRTGIIRQWLLRKMDDRAGRSNGPQRMQPQTMKMLEVWEGCEQVELAGEFCREKQQWRCHCSLWTTTHRFGKARKTLIFFILGFAVII